MIILRFLLLYSLFSCFVLGSDSLSIGFWNIENLFDLENDPSIRDDEFAIGGKKNVTRDIYELKIERSVEVLTDLNVDILGLCEVENISVLIELNNSYKGRDYKIIHFDSPDERGIDNALLYDPKKFELISSKPIVNFLGGDDKTRDILYVKGTFNRSLIHIFVNHWPSNYGGKKKAMPKRNSTARLLMAEVEQIRRIEEEPNIILLGDFNEDPDEQNVELLGNIGLTSLMADMVGKNGISTYIYRGTDYLYDQIIVSEEVLDKKGMTIAESSLYILDLPKYRQQEGKYKNYPFRFWAGDRLLGGYSDHLAIKVDLILN